MSKVPTRPYDSADYIDSPEAAAAYLDAAFEDGDPQIIAATLGDIARSKDKVGLNAVCPRKSSPPY